MGYVAIGAVAFVAGLVVGDLFGSAMAKEITQELSLLEVRLKTFVAAEIAKLKNKL